MATGSILLVDDDEAIQRFMARVLISEGYRVASASSGKEGLDLYQRHGADVVITDIVMPDSEGLETIRAFRRLNPKVKIIAISGQSPLFLELAQRFGAMYVLPKPFTQAELLELVAKSLG
jgi:two-component system, chemotaxis family, chemotaxis protein CheY